MKKTRKIRLLAFILTLCLTIGVLPLYVFADGTETELPEQITETTNENLTAFQLGLGEKSVAELENMTLSAADIPASISRETVEAKDHVLRLREQEADLNTVIFQNRDGGKTVYLFGSPVKYVDANGNIRDKSTTLVSDNVTVNGKTYAHSATDNFFGQYYPTMPQNGVMLAFGPYTVEMKPVITGVLTLRDTVVADNKVTYNKVFGTGTSLVYTPTLNGVKEDIILQTYTGKSSFSFTLKTNGLAILQDENDTFLADFEGNKVASLGDVIITDSANHTAYGTMTVVTKIEREEYTVTVNAPTAFLTSTTTVYPVTVDPTFTIQGEYTPDGYYYGDTIHDLCIYNGSNPGYPESSVGVLYYNEDSCETETARMLYRINPDYFDYEMLGSSFLGERFSSATLYVMVNSGGDEFTINTYPYTADWCKEIDSYGINYYQNGTYEDYSTNTEYDSYYGDVSSSYTVYSSSYISIGIDITDIVTYWKNHDNYDQGLMLKLDADSSEYTVTESIYLGIRQTEHTSSNVYITIDYGAVIGENYINNKQTGHFLKSNGNGYQTSTDVYIGDIDVIDENIDKKWNITYYGNDQYYITQSENSNYILYSQSGTYAKVGTKPTTLTSAYLWKITYNYSYDGYLLQNVACSKYLKATDSDTTTLSSTADSYCVWRMKSPDKYCPLLFFTVEDIVMEAGETKTPVITVYPGNATWASLKDFNYSVSDSSYTTYNSTTCNFTAVEPGTTCVTVVYKSMESSTLFNIKVNKHAIIIIPGFLGSELYVGDDNPYFEEDMPLFTTETMDRLSIYQEGDTLNDLISDEWWKNITNIPSVIELYNAWSDSMSCNDNGSSKYDIKVNEYRSADPISMNNKCGLGDWYLPLYTELINCYSDAYDIDLFSYDWRLSSAVSAARLDEYIDYYNYDKVILIAHSLGGLVASGYLGLGESQRNKVEQIFYLSSPLLGVPDVVNIWYNEDISFIAEAFSENFGVSLQDFNRAYNTITGIADPIQRLICNYISVYEALPSEYYFQITGSSYLKYEKTTYALGSQNTITEYNTYEATKNKLKGILRGFKLNLLSQAETFHNTTFIAGTHISNFVDAYYFYCTNTDTVSHLIFFEVISANSDSYSYSSGLDVDGTTENGDSLVTVESATLNNAYPLKCIGKSGNHMSLISYPAYVDDLIQKINVYS